MGKPPPLGGAIGASAMSTYKMNPSKQSYVFTDKNGVARGTFRLRSVYLYVSSGICEIHYSSITEQLFREGSVKKVSKPETATASHASDTGCFFSLDLSGNIASLMATLDAKDAEKNDIASAALSEFASAVKGYSDVRSFLLDCERMS